MENEDVFVNELLDDLESGQLQLPTLPEVALRVREVVDDENANAGQIAEIIAQDAALSARLIQVGNSPLYRGRQEIDRLPMVIHQLNEPFHFGGDIRSGTETVTECAGTGQEKRDQPRCEPWHSGLLQQAVVGLGTCVRNLKVGVEQVAIR